ncbi:MAG: hypothetical protein HDR15_11030 [Lachnospiraceae bacterium]|nr:hypothetical protein [Lachnospiraceae bacterium]
MDKMINCLKNRKLQETATGLCAVFGVYLAFCFSTLALSHENSLFMLLHLVTLGFAGAAYLIFCKMTAGRELLKRQMRVVNGVLWVCGVLFFAAQLWNGGESFVIYERLSQILCIAVTTAAGRLLHHRGKAAERRKRGLVSHSPLFLLCIVTMILVYDPAMRQFKWDGGLYYLACRTASVYSIGSMALYGHISQTVGAAIRFLTALAGNDLAAGMMLGNALMLLISICAFYGSVKALLPGRKEVVYVTAAAVYAWSPFVLGMVNYYSLDFYCMCLFPVVFYFTVRRQWILQVLSGLLFCFTKEPAIVVYGALCLGIVAADFWRDKQGGISDRIRRLFCTPQYYAMVSAALLWAATIGILGAWSGGNGGFSVDTGYVAEKCKVLFVLNFNWICTALILAGGGILLLCKKITADKVRTLLPLVTALAGFTLFSFLFNTVNHARYSDVSPVCLYLLCCLVLAGVAEQVRIWGRRLLPFVYAALAGILLLSCYRTIDPVSMYVFQIVPIGKELMITTGAAAPGDAMIYNRQALWFEKALSEVVSEMDLNEEILLFPTVNHTAYYFEGFAEAATFADGEYREFEDFWNPEYQIREAVASEDTIPMKVFAVSDRDAIDCMVEEHPAGRYVYVYLDYAGSGLARDIRKRYNVTEEKCYSYRGWQVYGIWFDGSRQLGQGTEAGVR